MIAVSVAPTSSAVLLDRRTKPRTSDAFGEALDNSYAQIRFAARALRDGLPEMAASHLRLGRMYTTRAKALETRNRPTT